MLKELSRVAFPGDAKDPLVRKFRAVWRSQIIREHAFDLVRRRTNIMERKFDMIRTALIGARISGIKAPVKRRSVSKRERARHACFVDDTSSRLERAGRASV